MKAETIQAAKENMVADKAGRGTLTDEGIRLVCQIEGITDRRGFKTLWLNHLVQALPGQTPFSNFSTPRTERIDAVLAR